MGAAWMSPVILVALGAAMTAAVLVVVALTSTAPQERRQMMGNLRRGLELAEQPERQDRDGGGAAGLVRRVTPQGWLDLIERLLSRAGRPAGWPVDRVLSVKLLAGGGAGALSFLLFLAQPSAVFAVMGLAVTSVAWFVPELLMYSRGLERSEKIARELPDTLDQMVIAVEAGLGFEAAMARTANNGSGPLAVELRRTIQDLQMGSPRKLAYESLADRANVVDVRRFVRAISQGEQHGISIADVLKAQAAEQRLKRRQRAEEKAMQIPVKVLFPLMVCILPVLFIVILGPAVINILGAFG